MEDTNTEVQEEQSTETVPTEHVDESTDTSTEEVENTENTVTEPVEDTDDYVPNSVQFNDAVLDNVVAILNTNKVSLDDQESIFGKAVQTGDMSDIDEAKGKEILGDALFNLIKSSVAGWFDNLTAMRTDARNKAIEIMDSEENLISLEEWMVKSIEGEDKKLANDIRELTELVGKGGRAMQYALSELKAMFMDAPDTVYESNNIVGTSPSEGFEPITSAAEYGKLLAQAKTTDEYNQVVDRWNKSKRRNS